MSGGAAAQFAKAVKIQTLNQKGKGKLLDQVPILSSRNLRSSRKPPFVWAIKNRQTGQVLYTQRRSIDEGIIGWQIPSPNRQNRLPKVERRDLYTPLACIELTSYHHQIQVLEALVRLKELRRRFVKQNPTQTRDWTPKDYKGNMWSNGHFRPSYIHEAVADIQTSLNALADSLSNDAKSALFSSNQTTTAEGEEVGSIVDTATPHKALKLAHILWENEWCHGTLRKYSPLITHGQLPPIDRGINSDSLVQLEQEAFSEWLKQSSKLGIAV